MNQEHLIEQAKTLATPALHARHTKTVWSSHLGGTPCLPKGSAWPVGRNPLSFLAQLDLGEVNRKMAIEWLPQSGTLLFFYDMECEAWGFDPSESNCWQVLYVPEGTETEIGVPENDSEIFDCHYLDFKKINTFSEDGPFLPSNHTMDEEAYEDFTQIVRTHDFNGAPMHQISGKPYAIQNENMELECQLASHGVNCGSPDGYNSAQAKSLREGARDWRLLLQLDSDDDAGWMWGDSGILYFWVREEDAARGDFSKVWICLQCC